MEGTLIPLRRSGSPRLGNFDSIESESENITAAGQAVEWWAYVSMLTLPQTQRTAGRTTVLPLARWLFTGAGEMPARQSSPRRCALLRQAGTNHFLPQPPSLSGKNVSEMQPRHAFTSPTRTDPRRSQPRRAANRPRRSAEDSPRSFQAASNSGGAGRRDGRQRRENRNGSSKPFLHRGATALKNGRQNPSPRPGLRSAGC